VNGVTLKNITEVKGVETQIPA